MRENSGPNGAGIRTYYTYDASGRLEGVESGKESGVASPVQHRTFDYDGRGFLKRECHPEKGYLNSGDTGCVKYSAFDAQGNPASRTDGPFTLAYAYDAIGRLTQVSEANAGLLKEFFYAPASSDPDPKASKLVQAKRHNYVDGTDYVVTETYGYEGPEGRVSSRRTTVRDLSGESAGSQWFEQSFTYDELGNLESQSYLACRHALCSTTRPDRTVSYTYNRGFLTAVPGYAPSLTYHRNGALATVLHENGALDAVTIADHWMPRPETMTSTPVSGAAWDSGPFVYDAAGNIQSIGPDQYYYDEVSRLVQAEVYLDGQQAVEHYTYDRFGNLTSMATQGLGSATFDTVTWNVDPLTNRLIPAAGEFAYDAAGNLTTSGAGTGTFDAFNMMTSLGGAPGRNERYLYTPQDERIATIGHLASPPSFEWTLRGLDQKVLTTYESELATFEPDPVNPGNPVQEHQGWSWQKDYIYRGSSLLAAEVTDNVGGENREHFHLDHLGTPRLKTDQYGTELASHKSLPYGEELTNPTLDNEVMQFTAHERDRDPAGHGNDLDYMHARYYSPRLGRFLSVDPVGGRPELPQSWNRYGYALSNPTGYVDPDGRSPYRSAQVLMDGADRAGGVMSLLVGLIPVVGDVKDGQEVLTGEDLLAGDDLSLLERGITVGAAVVPFLSGKAARTAVKEGREFFVDLFGDGTKLLPAKAGPTGQISPREVMGKTPAEIDKRAKELGLEGRGPDPASGQGSYVDPQTNQQRILSHPYADPPHGHVNDPSGNRLGSTGERVERESAEAHLEIRVD